MKNRFFIIVKQFLFTWLILSSTAFLSAQSITPQALLFNKICAGSYNQFIATFTYTGFPPSTTFFVLLSDNTGSFANPITTTTLSTKDLSSNEKEIEFAVPTTLIGSETYRLRVKSSTGVVSGDFFIPGSKTIFPAYYKPFEGPFYINNKASTVNICSGGNINLSIDNPTPNTQNSSPANYSNLKYKWYKGGSLIVGETGSSLNVNSTGTYYVEIDYSVCSDANYRSQDVVVNFASNGSATIASSLGNPFCSSSPTVLSTSSGNSYQWYKDNVAIAGEKSQTYSTNQAGNYSVAVNFGSCSVNGSIDLKNYDFTSSINVPAVNMISEGETLKVIVTTAASNPDYKWYLNGSIIPGATASTYDTAISGSYKVVITQTTGCNSSTEIPFELRHIGNAEKIPNIISLSSSYPFNVWDIPNEYKNPKTRVLIMNSVGAVALDTYDYQSDWPKSESLDFKNVNPVFYYVITSDNVEKKGSITIIK